MNREGFLEREQIGESWKGPNLEMLCKRALGWRPGIRTQD